MSPWYQARNGTRTLLAILALVAVALVLSLLPDSGDTSLTPMIVAEDDAPPAIDLAARRVTFADGSETTYRLASDFDIAVAAEDLGKARFMTRSPDGRLFVGDMIDFTDNRGGRLYILSDWNAEARRFESRDTYLGNLRNPHSTAFYTDADGRQWLYIAETHRLVRYPYQAGDTEPSGDPEVIATFPDYRTVDGDVWHITRTLLFHNNELYVSVGSSCNICEEPEDEVRAEIIVMTPEGENVRMYAEGLRNAVGLAWADGALYATNNGADHLGAEAPDDGFYRIEEGAHYGFPYCFEADGAMHEETNVAFSREPINCEEVPLSLAAFGPHTAPLGLTYFEDAHPALDKTFLAALHGSFRLEIGNGYSVVRVTKDGEQEIFMDGFLKDGGERVGRPVHTLQWDENSFFLTDDFNGRLYYIYAR